MTLLFRYTNGFYIGIQIFGTRACPYISGYKYSGYGNALLFRDTNIRDTDGIYIAGYKHSGMRTALIFRDTSIPGYERALLFRDANIPGYERALKLRDTIGPYGIQVFGISRDRVAWVLTISSIGQELAVGVLSK